MSRWLTCRWGLTKPSVQRTVMRIPPWAALDGRELRQGSQLTVSARAWQIVCWVSGTSAARGGTRGMSLAQMRTVRTMTHPGTLHDGGKRTASIVPPPPSLPSPVTPGQEDVLGLRVAAALIDLALLAWSNGRWE